MLLLEYVMRSRFSRLKRLMKFDIVHNRYCCFVCFVHRMGRCSLFTDRDSMFDGAMRVNNRIFTAHLHVRLVFLVCFVCHGLKLRSFCRRHVFYQCLVQVPTVDLSSSISTLTSQLSELCRYFNCVCTNNLRCFYSSIVNVWIRF
jgi:hypothetical protein